MANLAGLLEFLQCLHGLVDWRVVVGPVDQHQVDVVRVQAAQATFGVLDDVLPLRVQADYLRLIVVVEADFGD